VRGALRLQLLLQQLHAAGYGEGVVTVICYVQVLAAAAADAWGQRQGKAAVRVAGLCASCCQSRLQLMQGIRYRKVVVRVSGM
jgi:hypothetical protein